MTKHTELIEIGQLSKEEKEKKKKRRIQSYFNNRLIIIDEVHNIRISNDNKEKKQVAISLMELAKYTENMKFLLLSATPMYNSCKEILWLTNLMNVNDKRATIDVSDIFDSNGEFLNERFTKDGKRLESGRDLLHRKLIGYISFVRGENPFIFPYRIYPNMFSPENALMNFKQYPKIQMNNRIIEESIKNIPIYLNEIGEYQEKGYKFIIDCMMNKDFSFYTSMVSY